MHLQDRLAADAVKPQPPTAIRCVSFHHGFPPVPSNPSAQMVVTEVDMNSGLKLNSLSSPVCKWFARSGSCRSKKCRFAHVRTEIAGVQAHASYEQREWSLSSTEEDEQQDPGQQAWRFSVASYNILADKYARHYRSYLYHEVPSTYLDWHHRRAAIIAELADLLPDIICLQEVDRYEDLEAELQQLGYSGIYLQRDGGRRDGCATFWRSDRLTPAVVRQVRFSQYDLKDNVALLVLFEPCHAPALQDATASTAAAASTALPSNRHQQQQGGSLSQQQQQQQQQECGQSPQQGFLSQWLPRGWLWSNAGNSSNINHMRSSQVLLRPAYPPTHSTSATHQGSPGSLYQVPTQLHAQQQVSSRSSFEAPAAGYNSHSSSSGAASGKGGRRGHRRSGSCSDGRASRHHASQEQQLRGNGAAVQGPGWDQGQQELEQQQHAPDWVRCALLVANTHIIFTPDKGDVKLGQARMLVQEAVKMADWYLEQQQQQGNRSVHGGSSNGPAASAAGGCSPVSSSSTQAVAAILTGDFNATPNSPLYAYMSQGLLDLQTVNKRNVSHMATHTTHHKGYRGFRRANKRRSAEYQREQQQQGTNYQLQPLQQQGAAMGCAEADGQQVQQVQAVSAAVGVAGLQPSLQAGAGAGAGAAAAAGQPAAGCGSDDALPATPIGSAGSTLGDVAEQQYVQQQSSCSSAWRSNSAVALDGGHPGNSTAAAAHAACDSAGVRTASAAANCSHSPTVGSTSTGAVAASSTHPAASPQRSSSLQGSKTYKWSDREVRRAAGMSYDELVEASMSLLTSCESDAECPEAASPDVQISRAAAAFAAEAAAGSGAAAAAAAAATAAAEVGSGNAAGGSGGRAAGGLFSTAAMRSYSGSEPLLLQHGLQLQSSYKNVLGQEPDYTSSHSQFMDTCDYIWYTSTPLTKRHGRRQRQQQVQLAGLGAGSTSSASSSSSSCGDDVGSSDGGSSSDDGAGVGASAHYQLRPVAVLQPPDGMKLNKGLPSKHLGSDHICLLTDFELVLKYESQL